MSPKTYFLILTSVIGTVLLSVPLSIYVVDPHQKLRQGKNYDQNLGSTRDVCAGRLYTYDYNALFLGSSLSLNTRPSQIDKLFNTKCLLSAINASAGIFHKELALSLQSHSLDYFFCELWENVICSSDTTHRHSHYFEKQTPLTRLTYILDVGKICDVMQLRNYTIVSPDSQFYFPKHFYDKTYIRKRLHSYILKNDKIELMCMAFSPVGSNAVLYTQWIPLIEQAIRKNPQVKIYFFFTPSSILTYAKSQKTMGQIFENRRIIIQTLSRYPQIRLYDFSDIAELTHKIYNYYDFSHYPPAYNQYMLEAMAADSHRITPENMEDHFETLRRQIQAYDYKSLYDSIRALPDSEFLKE